MYRLSVVGRPEDQGYSSLEGCMVEIQCVITSGRRTDPPDSTLVLMADHTLPPSLHPVAARLPSTRSWPRYLYIG